MTALSGHAFSMLREGELALYRGSGEGLSPILLVTPVAEQPALDSLRRLEHEYALRTELDPDWAVRPLELTQRNGRPALVLEDPGGEPLDGLLDRPLETALFLRLAVALATALRRMHARSLIHKDIKPANVLVDVARGMAWLTGLGIASRLPREHQVPEPPEVIAGTLAYMAPEQTGRMNRSIDSRSDLYALGVTFYEMLTGALPFTATDPMAWVHCHIARQPVAPGERVPTVPGPISALVMKLLAKTAEDRYQTAAGVVADLQRCLTELQARDRIEPFPLGAHDASDQLMIPERLYGREAETGTLLAAFDRVVGQGSAELVLVSGYSGIGKSALVNELHKRLVPGGLFAAGKCDQFKRNVPYGTVAQAFQGLVHQILGKSDAELEQWRAALLEALGPNGQLIVNLIPELALIIGEPPPPPELPPQDLQARFQLVFRRFLAVFARSGHPLSLFLEDLQWLDAATLDLIEHLLLHPQVRHLLLIGAYRDNEVGLGHPLARMLAKLREAGGKTQEILLAPLASDDVERLLADALRTERRRVQPLAALVYEKTAGNPFFTIQFLGALAEEELLAFDPGTAAWRWDLPRIRAKGFTDNVADLMAAKLSRLPSRTRDALGQLACLGNAAEIATLALVHGVSEAALQAALWDAVRAGFVIRADGSYSFQHDRIQEAAYALIAEGERARAHLRIGQLLAARIAPEQLEERIFDIVNQFDRGAELITAAAEREQVAALNLRAGKRAKAASAYAAALLYFATGRILLGENGWERHYRLAFDLELNSGECEYLTGDLAAAGGRLASLSTRARTRIDSAAVAFVRINLYTNLDRSERAVQVGLDYLRQVDAQWPRQATAEDVHQEYDRLRQRLGARPIEALIDLPLMTDPDRRATMDVLTVLTSPALFTDLNLFRLAVGRMAALSLEHGNADASCLAYVWLGGVFGSYFGDYRTGARFAELGADLVEKRGLDRLAARVNLVFASHVAHWTRHLPTCRTFLRRSLEAAHAAGDLTCAAYSSIDLVTNLFVAGDPLADVEREAEVALDVARKVRFGLIRDAISAQLRLIRTLRGLTPDFTSFNDAEFDEGRFEQPLKDNPRLVVAASRYWVRKLQGRIYAGDFASAVACVEAIQSGDPAFDAVELSEFQFYAALARAGYCDMAPAQARPRHLEALKSDRAQIALWAANCPANFAHQAALLDAEIARLEGRDLDAMRRYDEAVRSAQAHGFVQNEGLANELAARFYAARGFTTISETYLRNARYCYRRWGAEGKVRHLDQLHPQLRHDVTPTSPTATFDASTQQLDVGTVVKASHAISGEIVLSRLLETLMTIALEHAGADRGLLVLLRGDEQRIEAEATTGQQTIDVRLRPVAVTPAELPESVLHTAIRTHQSVILDDAQRSSPFSEDEYIRRRRPRSVLCLPLIKQAELIGVLYLENSLTPHVFTPARIAVLQLLASQAASSLENARLYSELQHAEAVLAEAQRLSHTGSFDWHVSSGEISWSEESFRIFEYDPATKPTMEMVYDRVHPDDVAIVQQVVDRAATDEQGFDFEHRLLMPNGTVKHLHVVAHAITEEPGRLRLMGALMDITPRKQAHAALERSEHRYRHLFREMPVALWQLDAQPLIAFFRDLRANGVEDLSAYLDDHPDVLRRAPELSIIEEANDGAVQMFGARDQRELLGPMQWVWRESPDTLRRAIESRFRGEDLFQETTKLPTLDGRVIDVLYTVARPHTADKSGLTLISLVDLTERVRAQEMLRRVQADLAHAARISMLGELTASIAHELNQPLAAITVNGEAALRWLGRPVPDLAEARASTTRMIADARRSGDIIARIRGMAVRRAPERKLVSLDELILDTLVFLRQEAQSRATTILHQPAPGAPQVRADRIQLQQVIVNLAVNAMQAMAQAENAERKLTIRTTMPDAAMLCCMVEDSGPGIAPEHLDRLFNGFFTTKEGGMGMGLSICRSIVEAHGGRIAADNASAHGGARFYFMLPAAD